MTIPRQDRSTAASPATMVRRVWQSPTVMSWFSVVARGLGVLAVLPVMLRNLDPASVAVWYLLASLMGLQQLADMGFAPTFVRVLAYARGDGSRPEWEKVERIWQTMHVVYRRLTVGSVIVIGAFGSIALLRPISQLADPSEGWVSWGVVVATFLATMRGNAFAAYLQGMDRVALAKRWEAVGAAGGAITGIIVLSLGGGLLALVVANQAWVVVATWRNRWLSRSIDSGRASGFRKGGLDHDVFGTVWGSAVRSGAGVLLSRGVLLSSGLVYAQVADSAELASYLLAFRVMQMLLDFANAPFYSKIPRMAALYASRDFAGLEAVSARGMAMSYWSYCAGVVGLGVSASWALDMMGSSVAWVSVSLWAMLAVAYLIERFGAMHIQLYSTTNHIIWHKANGVSGIIYLVVSFALLPFAGVFAFPVGIAVGYASFYSWYAPLHVKRHLPIEFWRFQRRTALLPATVVLGYGLLTLLATFS